jgi:ascorbate-specific PTS system EIIC-type component UlaA
MSGWVRYLALTAKSKIGFGRGILVGIVIAAVLSVATLVFFSVAMFFLLADYVGPLRSALIMSGVFFVLAIIAAWVTISARRRAMERARQALTARGTSALFDSSMLTLGLEVGRTIGWKRLVPVAAVAILAVTLAKEWAGRGKTEDEE